MWAFPNSTSLDWTGRNALGCSQLDWVGLRCARRAGTGQSCYGLHCSALHLTGLDSTAFDLHGTWVMPDWNVLSWKGMNWNSTGRDWTGRTQISLNRLYRTSVEWTWLDWAGPLQKTKLDGTVLHRTGLHCTTLDWTGKYHTGQSLHLARLIYTELHSTFPKESDKDCTALYKNVLHWTRPHRIP